jgi:uncharacterized protein involved in exopolysaccharide biosynthesis
VDQHRNFLPAVLTDGDRPLPPVAPRPSPELIRLQSIVATVFLRKRFLAGVFFSVLVSGAIGVLLWPPRFESRMRLLVTDSRSEPTISATANAPQTFRSGISEWDVNAEVSLLTSRDVTQAVIEDAGLVPTDISIPAEVAASGALRALEADLSIAPLRQSGVIEVRYAATTSAQALRVMQSLKNTYLSKHVTTHRADNAQAFFEAQAKRYSQELSEATRRLVEFQRGGSDYLQLSEKKPLITQGLLLAEADLEKNRAAQADLDGQIRELGTKLQTLDSRIVTQSRRVPNQFAIESTQTLVTQLMNQRTDLLARYQPNDPLVVTLERKIADTKKILEETNSLASVEQATDVNPVKQKLESDLATALVAQSGLATRDRVLSERVRSLRESLSRMEAASGTFSALQREVDQLEETATLFAKKREEAKITAALDQSRIMNVSVIEQPNVPLQPWRSRSLLLGLVILAAVFGALATTLLLDLVRQTFRSPAELEQFAEMPVLITVPWTDNPPSPSSKSTVRVRFVRDSAAATRS